MSEGADAEAGDPAWYAEGLRFACTQCGNCCRNQGQYAFVNLSPRDLESIPAFLGISRAEFLERWCEKAPGCHPTLRMDQPTGTFSGEVTAVDRVGTTTVLSIPPFQLDSTDPATDLTGVGGGGTEVTKGTNGTKGERGTDSARGT